MINTGSILRLPLAALRESPTNPRKTMTGIDELAASIKEVGVMSPILVRPINGHGSSKSPDYKNGHDYEIVFGHRRFRAAQAAQLAEIPCMLADLPDATARRMQLLENLQRVDLHPMEEAEGLMAMLREHAVTVDDLVHQTRKSRTYIYNRLKLLSLDQPAIDAFYQGALAAEVAQLVARIPPGKLQAKALAIATDKGYRGELPSYRTVRDKLLETFTLGLKDAPWQLDDATLLPTAGACTTCPKRSGATPEIYGDIVSRKGQDTYYINHQIGDNVCTDPDCFAAKKTAHLKNQAAAAIAKGHVVVTGPAASKSLAPDRWDTHNIGVKGDYIAISEVDVKKAKADVQPVLIQDARSGKLVKAFKREDLKAAGVKLEPPKKQRDRYAENQKNYEAAQKKREQRAAAELKRRTAIADALRPKIAAAARSQFDALLVARQAVKGIHYEWLYKQWNCPPNEIELSKRLDSMSQADLQLLAIDCALVDDLMVDSWSIDRNKGEALLAAAKHYGVDVDAVTKETA